MINDDLKAQIIMQGSVVVCFHFSQKRPDMEGCEGGGLETSYDREHFFLLFQNISLSLFLCSGRPTILFLPHCLAGAHFAQEG